jgi:hypothetical protein
MRTAESLGQAAGCVQWEQFSEARPTRDQPRRAIVWFRFTNGCGKEMWIRWASLADDQSRFGFYSGLGSTLHLEAGARYGTEATASNYFFFDPAVGGGASFWLFEYSARATSATSPEMRGCSGNRTVAQRYAPCPPSFRYQP